jgi:hypothetical protein
MFTSSGGGGQPRVVLAIQGVRLRRQPVVVGAQRRDQRPRCSDEADLVLHECTRLRDVRDREVAQRKRLAENGLRRGAGDQVGLQAIAQFLKARALDVDPIHEVVGGPVALDILHGRELGAERTVL